MKVYICVDHDTYYPTGGASVVVAKNKKNAHELLSMALEELKLESNNFTLKEVHLDSEYAIVLNNGDY